MTINQHSCPKCNNAIPSDSEFCQYCGSKVNANVTITCGEELNNAATNYHVINNTSSKRKLLTITISLIVISILMTTIIIIAVNYNKSNDISPEIYRIAKMITDNPKTYCKYISELDSTLSKGSYGNDLKIEKATEYINNLPLDYGQRIILFKIQFPNDNTYNNDILDYLNDRDDLSYDDVVYILEELGFAVFDDGTVKW